MGSDHERHHPPARPEASPEVEPDSEPSPQPGSEAGIGSGPESVQDASLTALATTAPAGEMIGRGPGTREELPSVGPSSPASQAGPQGAPQGAPQMASPVHAQPESSSSGQHALVGSAEVALDDLDELTIVARAQDGDVHAFEWLLSAYQGGVFRLAFRMLNDHAEAEDIVQETFIAAWRSLPNLAAPQAFIPWLYRTATNKCFNHLRSRRRRPADLDSFDDEPGPGGSGGASMLGEAELRNQLDAPVDGISQDPALRYETEAQMQALAGLLQTVPAGPRACWLLRDVHEFSYAEIAAIVQQPESTVRGRIARARRVLAEGMQSWR